MNTHPLLVAALVTVPAVVAMLWAWRTVQRAVNGLHVEADLDKTDFDVGNWVPSSRVALPSVRAG